MAEITCFKVALVMFLELYAVHAMRTKRCLHEITSDLRRTVTDCHAASTYAECVIQVAGISQAVHLSRYSIRKLNRIINADVKLAGLFCAIDVRDLLKEIQRESAFEEHENELEHEEATHHKYCFNVYVGQLQNTNNCNNLAPFLKCVLHAHKIAELEAAFTDIEYAAFENTIQQTLYLMGFRCPVKISALLKMEHSNV